MADVQQLRKGPKGQPSTVVAGKYLHAFSQRRQLLAGCSTKLDALSSLAPALSGGSKVLVFSETTSSAKRAAKALDGGVLVTRHYSSELPRSERQELLDAFKSGEVTALAAPRVLDEGIDVPDADVGIVLAASSTRRQMVQRMGRVVRPKSDGRPATFVVVYVKDTSEDPEGGAHESFLSDLTHNAALLAKVDAREAPTLLTKWLRTT